MIADTSLQAEMFYLDDFFPAMLMLAKRTTSYEKFLELRYKM